MVAEFLVVCYYHFSQKSKPILRTFGFSIYHCTSKVYRKLERLFFHIYQPDLFIELHLIYVALQFSWASLSRNLILAYQSFGVVYGDLSTSPLYVFRSTFVGKLQHHQNEDAIFGAFSLIFWTLTFIPLLKYVVIVLSADDNGEGAPWFSFKQMLIDIVCIIASPDVLPKLLHFVSGGTFALYSMLCRHAKFGLLPNQQAADEELSAYKYGPSRQGQSSLPLRRFLEKHKKIRTALLVVVLLGTSMLIGDGVITPAISGNLMSSILSS